MRKHLLALTEERIGQLTGEKPAKEEKVIRKLDSFAKREAEIVKVSVAGRVKERKNSGDTVDLRYFVHYRYLINHKGKMYMEEEVEERHAAFAGGALNNDREVPAPETVTFGLELEPDIDARQAYVYDRQKAVQYAERWWNDYNPAYVKFEVDCTNYISQCLHAGGAPMTGFPNRTKGWWLRGNNWSYSWSVANALKTYLPNAKSGLRAKTVGDPRELLPGDVICYDFQGDGRYDHNTIVTAKDADGMPLVNAHTANSRMRYWAYEDSTAYTPNIQYRFYSIIDDS